MFVFIFLLSISTASYANFSIDSAAAVLSGNSQGGSTGGGNSSPAPSTDGDIAINEGPVTPLPDLPMPDLYGKKDQGKVPVDEGLKETQVKGLSAPGAVDVTDDFLIGSAGDHLTSRLPRFGAGFFAKAPSTFAPLKAVPVGPDYVVGPGDEIRIAIWGLEERHFSVVVDRNGSISLPIAGVVGAAGLNFGQLQSAVKRAYSRYLNEFDINVTMGRLHSVTVYVVGNARRPGAYTVSSLSTMINVLLASGGPARSGTMRNIKLKRNGRVIATFDTYDLLLKGDKSRDARVMAGDIIFIPTVGPLAGITGDVRRPAIYEIKKKNIRLSKLIDMAGGLNHRSYKGRVQIERFDNNEKRIAFESDLVNIDNDISKNRLLQNGDLVKIYAVPVAKAEINLTGVVANPGKFVIEQGTTRLSDVVKRAGGPLYMASEMVEITRVDVTQQGPVTRHIKVNIKKALMGDRSNDPLLQVNDYIMVRTVPEWDLYKTVNLMGEVKYPGSYTIKKGEKLSDLLERAGGITDKAFLLGSVFLRYSEKREQQKHIDAAMRELKQNLAMAAIQGANSAATNSSAQASKAQIDMQERFLNSVKGLKATGRIVVKLPQNLNLIKGTPYDIELKEGDRLYIPTRPNTVHVVGMVKKATTLIYRPGQTFSSYVKQAGGYAPYANWKKAYIIRADGSSIRAYVRNRPAIVQEGDAIVIPQKIMSGAGMRQTRDLIDMISKTALSAAMVNNIIND